MIQESHKQDQKPNGTIVGTGDSDRAPLDSGAGALIPRAWLCAALVASLLSIESAQQAQAQATDNAGISTRSVATERHGLDSNFGQSLEQRVGPTWKQDEDWYLDALRTGTIVRLRPIGVGITNPFKAEVEFEQRRLHAVWKPIRGSEFDNKESYQAEIAAYRLSRHLGIDLVPPTVERKIGRQRGSLQLWVENHETFAAAIARQPSATLKAAQTQLMRLFDVLIDNPDRHGNNLLVDQHRNMVLIDHSRALNYDNWGPQREGKQPTRFQADVVQRLRDLDLEAISSLLGDQFTKSDLRSLHRSAQRLLEHIDEHVLLIGELAFMADENEDHDQSKEGMTLAQRPAPNLDTDKWQ